jgi:hypothetical protein
LAIPNEVTTDIVRNFIFLTKIAFFDNPLVAMAGIVGLGLFVMKRGVLSFPSILIAGFPLAYLATALFVWPHPDSRYMLPLLPSLIIGAAYFIATCFNAAFYAYPKTVRRFGTALLMLALLSSVIASVGHTKLILETDTRVLAYRWVLAEVPDGTALIVESNYFELPRNASATEFIRENLPGLMRTKDRYVLEHRERALTPGYLALSNADADVILASHPDIAFEYFIRSFFSPQKAAQVPEGYTLVKSFYPRNTFMPLQDSVLDPSLPFGSLGRVDNLGPYVEVYRKGK